MSGKLMGARELEQHIVDFMGSQGMCVLATCGAGEPRASAVEFFPDGTTIYMLTEGGRKIENIGKNPRVSVAIHTQFTGWDSSAGVQITGTAEIGRAGSAIFAEGEAAYARRKGATTKLPAMLNVVKIRPQRIEMLDLRLRARGYDVRQVLEC